MQNSLRSKLSKLRYDGHITSNEYALFIAKMSINEKDIRNNAIDEFVKKMEEWNENVKSIRNEEAFFTIENIRKIAGQMKGGGNNEY